MPSKLFGWDTVTFIAVLNGGIHRTPDEIAGLREVVDMVDRRHARIVTSGIVITEVLNDAASLELLLQRPEYLVVTPGTPILQKVRDIRSAVREVGRSLKTPDAHFVATAILYRAEALHTFDDNLIALSGLSCVDGLFIGKPKGTQTTLAL